MMNAKNLAIKNALNAYYKLSLSPYSMDDGLVLVEAAKESITNAHEGLTAAEVDRALSKFLLNRLFKFGFVFPDCPEYQAN